MEERLEGFLFGLEPVFNAILWISFILRSCSSAENCCNEAYMISATFAAAFFCLVSMFSVFMSEFFAARTACALSMRFRPFRDKPASSRFDMPDVLIGTRPACERALALHPISIFPFPSSDS